jgi:hypothetical protein
MDYSGWVAKYGMHRRLLRWIIGNPLIAITMVRHDQTAALFVPVELLIVEAEDGAGCSVIYVAPSSTIAYGDNADVLAAAQALDAKLDALVASAVV